MVKELNGYTKKKMDKPWDKVFNQQILHLNNHSTCEFKQNFEHNPDIRYNRN